jgi:TPR repeat protein
MAAIEAGWPQARGELERYWFARGQALLQEAVTAADVVLVEAVHCFRQAATSGHRRAAFMLAECLRHGTGAAIDIPEAIAWYRKAAVLADAKVILGDLFYFAQGIEGNPAEAFHWYQEAALQHADAYAMYSCGYCLLRGDGVRRDARAAAEWLRRAALQGETDACFELGMLYCRGEGVRRSQRLGAKWLRAAARLGHLQARDVLEAMERGERV